MAAGPSAGHIATVSNVGERPQQQRRLHQIGGRVRAAERQGQVTIYCEMHVSVPVPSRVSLLMEFAVVFLVFAASMWLAWRRPPRAAISLFALGMALTGALYLRHATDALPLSF